MRRPDQRPAGALLALAVLLALAARPVAGQHPNHSQGFRPEHVFEAGGVENVNVFNGSLVLTIPIGPSYPVGPEFSYGLTVTYSPGSLWEWEETEDDWGEEYLKSKPRRNMNAGLGWELGFGRLLAPQDPGNSSDAAQYQSPDQALHELVPNALHPNGQTFSGQVVSFTQDGTYLRFQNASQTLEHPDGTRRIFGLHGPTRIEDASGNGLSIAYLDLDAAGDARRWRLTDDHGRTHTVLLAKRQGRLVVTEVQLEAFGGATAFYRFSYTDRALPRACHAPVHCTGGDGLCGTMDDVTVPLLTRVELPDLSAYSMPATSYHTSETGSCPNERRRINGHLERLDLPAGGAFAWDWDVFQFPVDSGRLPGSPRLTLPESPFTSSVGVSERRHLNRSGGVLGSWSYQHELTAFGDGFGQRELVVTETATPPGHVTEHYFSVWAKETTTPPTAPPGGWTEHEYGLPFTRRLDDGTTAQRFLSRRIYDDRGGLKRSLYVRYERSGVTKANPRLASQRTVYHDDAGRRADVELTDFDGLGHFRQETTAGTFPGGNVRTAFTRWNPGSSVADIPDPSEPWILGTYDLRQVTEGSQTATQELWFNDRGLLRRTRSRKGAACGPEDVVVDYVRGTGGFPARDDSFGGDGGTLSCGALSTLDLTSQTLRYRQRHTWSCGALATSGVEGTSFLSADRTIDCPSGMVASARDGAGLQTSFSYDLLGRLTLEDLPPGQGADTTYQYDREGTSGNLPARVTVQRKNGATVLTEAQVRVDGFGRVEEERRTLPDGTLAVRHTLWSSRGWIENRSEWEADGDPERSNTLFRQYDFFGRPGSVTMPDGKQVTIDYQGDGSRTIRVPVATGLNAAGEPILTNASTTETYDRFGRLVHLDEPNGTRTSYTYDVLGNLATVQVNSLGSPTQTRSFSYDGRGFLTSESHPELGTSILYSDFDPLGNPGRIRRGGWDLAYSFDAAARLTQIKERGTTKVWKSWDYATANFQAGQWSNGKLRSASRHNRIFVPGTTSEIDVVASEGYTYDGLGGRISSVQTTVGVGSPGDNTQPTFTYSLAYDPLGNVSSRSQPACTFNFCSGSAANPVRTVTAAYAQGLLTAVPGHASSITYHPNGLFAQVTHTNGVLDLQEKDPNDMARLLRLRTSGASDDFDTGAFSYDGAGNITKMGSHRYVYDLLSRIGEAQVEVPGTGCGDELLLASGTETGTVTRESCGTVRAEGSYGVGSTGDVTLRAGKRVVLGDGFSVASGGRLVVGTDPALDPEGEPKGVTQSYTFDLFGNLTQVDTEPEGGSPVTRTIGTNAATNRLSVASYDLSGNVTSWSGRTYQYDPFNMLWQTKPTSGNGHTFVYGPGDERLWTIDWTTGAAAANWVSTWTLRDLDGPPLRQFRNVGENTTSANWSFHRDYVYRDGALLAAHTPEGLQHFHLDHLGSPRIITGANGSTLAQHLYFPFGEEATSATQDDEALKFTGHERDDLDASGTTRDLDYMHARFHSPHLGRFFSPDPVDSASLPNPQSWNKYSYVRSNPLKFLDPTGEAEVHFTFNAFIPLDQVAMPFVGRIFEGDGAGFSADRTSVRIQQQFTIETDPSVSANPLVSVAQPKIGVTRELNSQGATLATGQASGKGVTVGAQRLADGTILLQVRGHAKNPLVWYAPGIDYSYRIAITPDGKILCLNCSHDQFPAYDAYMTVTGRKPETLFQYGPITGWFAAAALFPLSPNRSFSELLYEGGYWLDGVWVPK